MARTTTLYGATAAGGGTLGGGTATTMQRRSTAGAAGAPTVQALAARIFAEAACASCGGSGASNDDRTRCPACGGSGVHSLRCLLRHAQRCLRVMERRKNAPHQQAVLEELGVLRRVCEKLPLLAPLLRDEMEVVRHGGGERSVALERSSTQVRDGGGRGRRKKATMVRCVLMGIFMLMRICLCVSERMTEYGFNPLSFV